MTLLVSVVSVIVSKVLATFASPITPAYFAKPNVRISLSF